MRKTVIPSQTSGHVTPDDEDNDDDNDLYAFHIYIERATDDNNGAGDGSAGDDGLYKAKAIAPQR